MTRLKSHIFRKGDETFVVCGGSIGFHVGVNKDNQMVRIGIHELKENVGAGGKTSIENFKPEAKVSILLYDEKSCDTILNVVNKAKECLSVLKDTTEVVGNKLNEVMNNGGWTKL